jgi:hypothetical protein
MPAATAAPVAAVPAAFVLTFAFAHVHDNSLRETSGLQSKRQRQQRSDEQSKEKSLSQKAAVKMEGKMQGKQQHNCRGCCRQAEGKLLPQKLPRLLQAA